MNVSSTIDIDAVIAVAGTSAAILAVSLVVLQTDFISRKVLSPLQLYTKRRKEQLHQLDNAIADSILRIRHHVNERNNFEARVEREVTELILQEDPIKTLVGDIAKSETCAIAPIIVGISKDLTIPKNEWYVYLAFPQLNSFQADGINHRYNRRVQVPLVHFCRTLAMAFEEESTNNKLCFIADASSSLSSKVFSEIFTKCQAELEIPIIQEPAWMITVALLLRRKAISMEETEKVLFALCRLELLRLQLLNKIGKEHETVVFILPGQSCTKSLLSILQKLFPGERHVFAYDGCVSSVHRGLALLKHSRQNHSSQDKVTAMPRQTTAAIPLLPMHNTLPRLPSLLTGLSNQMAGILEAWISSIDELVTLKEEEQNNSYFPFVCRMNFIVKQPNINGSLHEQSRLALSNVLQYITGSRLNPLKEEKLDAACSALVDFIEQDQKELDLHPQLTQRSIAAIENCVYAHKLNLIDNATLPDTVLPKEEWSLKATES